jgi:hypothetical protein
MFGPSLTKPKTLLLAGLLAGSIVLSTVRTHAAQGRERLGETLPAISAPALSPTPKTVPSSPAAASSMHGIMMYRRIWGVDNIKVREISSGLMLRFSYRVVDADKAKILNDKNNTPYLIDETTGVKMEVPTMEKVGQLRQTATPQNGREYWMVFTNRGVKPGSRVDIVIGRFRIDRLVVEGITRSS